MEEELALFPVEDSWWVRKRCPVCAVALCRTSAFTYVVQRQGWVKIGATNNVRKRLSDLRRLTVARPVRMPPAMDWEAPLIHLYTFAQDVEHALHQRFATSHAFGEWFLPDEALRAWLADPVV